MGFRKNSKKLNIFHFMVPILILVLFIVYISNCYKNSFDETIFSVDNVYEHIKELSSPKYNGRLTGTEGNELATQYVKNHFKNLGIEPAGENGTYSQYFKSIVPQIDNNPYFRIEDENGEMLEEFKLYEDYRLYTGGAGGGVRFEGDILFVDRYLYKIDSQLIKDKVVVMGGYSLRPKDEEYIRENGGRGLLFTSTNTFTRSEKVILQKGVGRAGKNGETMFIAFLGNKAYAKFKKYSDHKLIEEEYKGFEKYSNEDIPKSAGIIKGAKLKCDVKFPITKSTNIIGKIQGKKSDGGYLIIGAHLDHVGSGPGEKYFPGALDNASGIGMILELARVIKTQKNLPDKTIIFAAWNSEENGINGSRYYVQNPIYPLDKTYVINLDCVGGKSAQEVGVESCGDIADILKSKIYQYGEDKNINIVESYGGTGSDHQYFIAAKVPAVTMMDSMYDIHTEKDTIDNISKENLGKVGAVLTNYIKRDIFKDTLPDYLNKVELSLIMIFLLGIILIYIVFSLNNANNNIKIFNLAVEDIYYSWGFNILLKCFYFITPVFIILFALLFIANLPPNLNMIFYNGEAYTNLSWYLTIKKSFLYIRGLVLNGFGTTNNHTEVVNIIYSSMGKSLKLIFIAIIISLTLGVFKGVFDSYRGGKKGDLRTVGTLIALSFPDVFIVLCSLFLIIYIANNDMISQMINPKILRGFIMPLLTLSIIPTVYISRITFIGIQEDAKKGYISGAKAKGLTKLNIYIKHILSSVILKVVDSMPTLITIIISNLIIVEYLFNYNGIVYNLYRFYKQNDMTSFVGLSLALGLIYVIFIVIAKIISKLINPMKREGAH